MPIPFQCTNCDKSTNVPDEFAGKKVKCKCGQVVVVKRPLTQQRLQRQPSTSAPAPPLKSSVKDPLGLDNVSFEVVNDRAASEAKRRAAERVGPATGGKSAPRKLSKREREDQVLAAKLGQDWKAGPKSEYVQMSDPDNDSWILDAWDVIRRGPFHGLAGIAIGVALVCAGVLMFEWIAGVTNDDATTYGLGRRRRGRFAVPFLLFGLGAMSVAGGIYVVFASLMHPDVQKHYSKGKLVFLIATSISLLIFVACFIAYRMVT